MLTNVQKVSKLGNSLTIFIPKKIEQIMDIEEGDHISVSFLEVFKKGNLKIKEEEKENKERRSKNTLPDLE